MSCLIVYWLGKLEGPPSYLHPCPSGSVIWCPAFLDKEFSVWTSDAHPRYLISHTCFGAIILTHIINKQSEDKVIVLRLIGNNSE